MNKCKQALLLAAILVIGGCSGGKTTPKNNDPAEPAFAVALFSVAPTQVTNRYFPLRTGQTSLFQVETEDGFETIVVEVLDTTRTVAGVECVVVRDRVYLGELLIEDTHDWYAQDDEGNVWYMGEEVVNYEYDDDDNLIGTDNDGAWEAGVDGAEPGIIMKATLQAGDRYRQEYWEGEAEDMGEIVALDVLVTLENGASYRCLQTRDWNPLEVDAVEFKYYAPGIGLIVETNEDGDERVELGGEFSQTPTSLPAFNAANFSDPTTVDHALFPLTPEEVQTFTEEAEDGATTIISEVLDAPRRVNGIDCVVVRVREYEDELLIEDTHDWYAQDDAGNVWYMGESVINYEYDDDDEVTGTNNDGEWEAGVDGAQAGIIMWATPVVGASYYQEFYDGEAEDMGMVLATGVEVELDNGRMFGNCLAVLEWTPLEPWALEVNFYAPGYGSIQEIVLEEDAVPVEWQGTFDKSEQSLADFDAATFTDPQTISHNYLGFTPGATAQFEAETDEGTERIVIEVLDTPRVVNGISCRVVRDRVYLDGTLIEDTHDWYAQDDAGNVWYMGEEVVNYEFDDDGNLLETNDDGSWEAGVDGAEAGVLMWATPVVDRSYYQEFYEEEAEDMAVIIATGVTVELEDGTTFQNCLRILERTALEPETIETKYYAPGIGVVVEEKPGGGERVELVSSP